MSPIYIQKELLEPAHVQVPDGVRNLHIQIPTDQPAMIFTVETTGVNESFTITCGNVGTYNATINWGDGDQDAVTTYDDAGLSHVYSAAGTHTITVTGTLPHLQMYLSATDRAKVRDIQQWGTLGRLSMYQAFRDCASVTCSATDGPDLGNVTDMQEMFRSCSSFNGDVSNWDVSNIELCNYTFFGCSVFEGNGCDQWDVSSIISLFSCFRNCYAFNSDISGWNTSNIEGFFSTFNSCLIFNRNLGGWDVGNVVSMNWMLYNTNLSVANYDATLIGWAAQSPLIAGLTLGAEGLQYSAAAASARSILTSAPNNWTINDAGQV